MEDATDRTITDKLIGLKIGLLAYSSPTGLGYQTKTFYDFLFPEKTLVADLSQFNGMPTNHESWYPKRSKVCKGFPTKEFMEWLTDGIDVLLVCEQPLEYDLFKIARKKGVKIVLQYNYEFLQYIKRPQLPAPDLFLSPSYWHVDKVEALDIAPVEVLPPPVWIRKFIPRKITEVNTLFHVMGRPAVNDRNGTRIFLQLAEELGDEFDYIIYIQSPREDNTERLFHELKPELTRLKEKLKDSFKIRFDTPNNTDLYKEGDLLILPRRFGGLCLPMWESLASGVPVVMPNISPNEMVLPEFWLVDAEEKGYIETHSKIPMYEASLRDLVSAVRVLKSRGPDIIKDSYLARFIAEQHSNIALMNDYYKILSGKDE